MLVFEAAGRRYGARRALAPSSFRVERGELVALVGPNGAGKSTLLRLAATLESPTEGRVLVDGQEGQAARARIGWLGQEPGLYDELTVAENLRLVAAMHGRNDAEIDAAAAEMRLADKLRERAKRLSRGEKQRAALARALLGGELLLLDEPTTALDAEAAEAARASLTARRGKRTILVATHDVEIAKRADRVLRLEGGRLA